MLSPVPGWIQAETFIKHSGRIILVWRIGSIQGNKLTTACLTQFECLQTRIKIQIRFENLVRTSYRCLKGNTLSQRCISRRGFNNGVFGIEPFRWRRYINNGYFLIYLLMLKIFYSQITIVGQIAWNAVPTGNSVWECGSPSNTHRPTLRNNDYFFTQIIKKNIYYKILTYHSHQKRI